MAASPDEGGPVTSLPLLDRLRRRWDVAADPADPIPFARLRDLINLRRLELIGWIALANELVEALMNLGFALPGYYDVIAANVAVDAGVIVLARATLARGGARLQAWVTPLTVTLMLLIAQASIYALATMGRVALVYPLYLLLAAVLFVLPPRTLAAILAGSFASYLVTVELAPITPIDRLSTLRTAAIAGAVALLAGSLIHAARERDHAQKRAIQDSNARLRQRNAEMDEVMAFAAHDLRSPLLGLRNLITFTLPRLAAEPALAVPVLEETGRSLADTLARIGRLLAAHEAEYGPVRLAADGDLRLALTAAARRNRALALAADVGFDLVLPERPVIAPHDPEAMERILDNLIANAVRFSPAGACVTLRCRSEPAGAIVTVEDAGPGIPEAMRAHLFGKFGRGHACVSRGGSGAGLGLFIAAMLTERLGGRLGYRTAEPQGSIFEIALDLVREPKQI